MLVFAIMRRDTVSLNSCADVISCWSLKAQYIYKMFVKAAPGVVYFIKKWFISRNIFGTKIRMRNEY